MSKESFEDWYLDHTKCGGLWSTPMIQCAEIVWNHQAKKLEEKDKRIAELEERLSDYDKRWKERYLVNNPFEAYGHGDIAR